MEFKCVFLFQAAFLLPILQQLMADGVAASRFSELQEPEVVIVAPTRELINQIYLEARKFAFGFVETFSFNYDLFNPLLLNDNDK